MFRFISLIVLAGFGVIDLLNFSVDSISSDIRLFILFSIWIVVLKINKWKSDATFKLGLGVLGVLFLFFIFSRDSVATQRIAVWLYFVLIVGVIQQFLELRGKKEKIAH